ncbi:MAG: hypothetical protein JNL49_14160 [Bacteroidia bacterium]|nr:hypothetical protein [Bacteroidia bacterium]
MTHLKNCWGFLESCATATCVIANALVVFISKLVGASKGNASYSKSACLSSSPANLHLFKIGYSILFKMYIIDNQIYVFENVKFEVFGMKMVFDG